MNYDAEQHTISSPLVVNVPQKCFDLKIHKKTFESTYNDPIYLTGFRHDLASTKNMKPKRTLNGFFSRFDLGDLEDRIKEIDLKLIDLKLEEEKLLEELKLREELQGCDPKDSNDQEGSYVDQTVLHQVTKHDSKSQSYELGVQFNGLNVTTSFYTTHPLFGFETQSYTTSLNLNQHNDKAVSKERKTPVEKLHFLPESHEQPLIELSKNYIDSSFDSISSSKRFGTVGSRLNGNETSSVQIYQDRSYSCNADSLLLLSANECRDYTDILQPVKLNLNQDLNDESLDELVNDQNTVINENASNNREYSRLTDNFMPSQPDLMVNTVARSRKTSFTKTVKTQVSLKCRSNVSRRLKVKQFCYFWNTLVSNGNIWKTNKRLVNIFPELSLSNNMDSLVIIHSFRGKPTQFVATHQLSSKRCQAKHQNSVKLNRCELRLNDQSIIPTWIFNQPILILSKTSRYSSWRRLKRHYLSNTFELSMIETARSKIHNRVGENHNYFSNKATIWCSKTIETIEKVERDDPVQTFIVRLTSSTQQRKIITWIFTHPIYISFKFSHFLSWRKTKRSLSPNKVQSYINQTDSLAIFNSFRGNQTHTLSIVLSWDYVNKKYQSPSCYSSWRRLKSHHLANTFTFFMVPTSRLKVLNKFSNNHNHLPSVAFPSPKTVEQTDRAQVIVIRQTLSNHRKSKRPMRFKFSQYESRMTRLKIINLIFTQLVYITFKASRYSSWRRLKRKKLSIAIITVIGRNRC